jgi:hypothetical protein
VDEDVGGEFVEAGDDAGEADDLGARTQHGHYFEWIFHRINTRVIFIMPAAFFVLTQRILIF